MKTIIVICILSVVFAAPDRSAKQTGAQGTDTEPMLPEVEDAPYPPSGWKPQGVRLELKPNDEFKPTLTVKFDLSKNGLSSDDAETTTTAAETTTVEEETTTENENDLTTTEMPAVEETSKKPVEVPSKVAEDESEKEKLEQLEDEKEAQPKEEKLPESYYILIPDGGLQRVLYTVISDPERQQFSSRFQTSSVNSPLVYYTPQYFTIY